MNKIIVITPTHTHIFGIHSQIKVPLWELWDLAPYTKGPGKPIVLPMNTARACEPAPALHGCSLGAILDNHP